MLLASRFFSMIDYNTFGPRAPHSGGKKSNFFRSSFFSRVFVCLHKTTTQKPGTNPAAPVRRAAAKRARKARERRERTAPPPSSAPRPILPPQNFRAKAGRRNRCKAGANQRQRQQRKAGEPERNAGHPARIIPDPPRRIPESRERRRARIYIYFSPPCFVCARIYKRLYIRCASLPIAARNIAIFALYCKA